MGQSDTMRSGRALQAPLSNLLDEASSAPVGEQNPASHTEAPSCSDVNLTRHKSDESAKNIIVSLTWGSCTSFQVL